MYPENEIFREGLEELAGSVMAVKPGVYHLVVGLDDAPVLAQAIYEEI